MRFQIWVDFTTEHDAEKVERLIIRTLEKNNCRVNYATLKARQTSPGRPQVNRPRIAKWIDQNIGDTDTIRVDAIAKALGMKETSVRRVLRVMEQESVLNRRYEPEIGVVYYLPPQ